MAASQETTQTTEAPGGEQPQHARIILTIVLAVQLMIAVDITVMNIALPQVQKSLHFSPTSLSWVINTYTLAFGGLLLLGGRLGDILGHRRALMLGIGIFSAASLVGGLAQNDWTLIAARVFQGAGGALAAPSTLAIIVMTFTGQNERTKALGVFVMAQGIGSAAGLIVGGLLTDTISWRWVLFINIPIGVAGLLLAPRYIADYPGRSGRFDAGGALTGTGGIASVVYGFVHAADAGWSNATTSGAFVLGIALLGVFVAIESRHPDPIMKLSIFADRDRSGGFLIFVCSGAAMFGMMFFLTQFVQEVIGLSPLTAGFAFLPMAIPMIFIPRMVTPRLVERFGARPTMMGGLGLIAVSMAWLTQLTASSGYAAGLFAPMLLAGAGVGLLNAPLTATILARVAPEDAGSASGALQAVGMIGGAVGTSILVTIFGSAIRGDAGTAAAGTAGAKSVLAHGIATACAGGTAFAVIGLLIVAVVIRTAKAGDAVPAAS